MLDSDESEDDDDGMPNKISKSKGPKKGFYHNKSSGNQGHGNKGSGKKSSGNKDSGNEGSGNKGSGNKGLGNKGSGNKGSGNKGLGNKGIGKGKSNKKAETDDSNMSMGDLWKEGRNGQDSEKDTTDKEKAQTSFVGTMMKIRNLLSKRKDCSTDENENFQSERDMDADSSRSEKCSRKSKNVENEENNEQVDNPLEDEAVPETGERDGVNKDEEVYSNVENKDKKKKDKKKKKKKKECQEESNDDQRSSPMEGEREKKKKKKKAS